MTITLDRRLLLQNRRKYPKHTTSVPSMEELSDWTYYEGTCAATDGCAVEPDGICQHGHPSWLLKLGLI